MTKHTERKIMADIRQVTEKFAVSPQIDEDDFPEIAGKGFTLVVNNRPDGETFGQLSSVDAEKAALANSMSYKSIPFSGMPTMTEVDGLIEILDSTDAPIFAYCRSGTRSCTLWALASVKSGRETADSALEKARNAGYDLSHIASALNTF